MVFRTPPTFMDLPNECLLIIMQKLEPTDILSLRQTCKLLEDLTKKRGVWKHILQNIMLEQCIPREVYPLPFMDRASLEHAALMPTRFVKLVKSEDESLLEPILTCRLSNRLTPNEQSLYGALNEGRPVSFCAALGGRYLVIKAYHQLKNPIQGRAEAAIFTLWDVGVSQARPKVLARMAITANHGMARCQLHGLLFDPRPEHEGTLYLVCYYEEHKMYLRIYRLNINSPSPEFQPHAKISLPERTNKISVSHQLYTVSIQYILGNTHAFMMWKFIEDKWVNWIARDCPVDLDSDFHTFFFESATVTTSHAKDLAIYNLPEFTQGQCPPPLPLQANLIVKAPLQNGHVTPGVAPYSEMHPFICHHNNRKVVLQKAVNLVPLNTTIVPRLLPVVSGTINLPHLSHGKISFLDNTNKNFLLLGSMDRQWKKCSLSVIDLDSDGQPMVTEGDDIKVKTAKLGLLGNIALAVAEICSLKGRMFVITDNTSPQVHVLDYVLPSDSLR